MIPLTSFMVITPADPENWLSRRGGDHVPKSQVAIKDTNVQPTGADILTLTLNYSADVEFSIFRGH